MQFDGDQCATGQFLPMLAKNFYAERKLAQWRKSDEAHDAGMLHSMQDGQGAKIFIAGDDDPPLFFGNFDYLGISGIAIPVADETDIATMLCKRPGEAQASAGIDQ